MAGFVRAADIIHQQPRYVLYAGMKKQPSSE